MLSCCLTFFFFFQVFCDVDSAKVNAVYFVVRRVSTLGITFSPFYLPSRKLDMGLTLDCIFINARPIAVIAMFLAVVAVVVPYFFCEFHFAHGEPHLIKNLRLPGISRMNCL